MYKYEISGCSTLMLIILFVVIFAKQLFYLALAFAVVLVAIYIGFYIYRTIQVKKREKDLCNPDIGEVYKICPYCNTSVKVSAKTCPNCNHALN